MLNFHAPHMVIFFRVEKFFRQSHQFSVCRGGRWRRTCRTCWRRLKPAMPICPLIRHQTPAHHHRLRNPLPPSQAPQSHRQAPRNPPLTYLVNAASYDDPRPTLENPARPPKRHGPARLPYQSFRYERWFHPHNWLLFLGAGAGANFTSQCEKDGGCSATAPKYTAPLTDANHQCESGGDA